MRFGQLVSARPLLRFALTRPAVPVPPPEWSYNDAMVSLIAPILARATGTDLSTLAQRQLFEPLGIDGFEWRRDRDGHPLAAGGLVLRTRDLLKLAALMADGGRWNGTQVVPEAWVTECLTAQEPDTWRAGPVTDIGMACCGSPGACTASAWPGPEAMAVSFRCWRPTCRWRWPRQPPRHRRRRCASRPTR
jgi:CubicO group peptidase (beta-lactamase class C family)